MRSLLYSLGISGVLLLASTSGSANPLPAGSRNGIEILFKDGHRQSLSTSEVQRIDFKAPAAIVFKDGHSEKISGDIERIEFSDSAIGSMAPGRSHYLGKWEVGEGNGGRFFITLEPNGNARKSIGPPHGTWTLIDGEARIAWEDGWHDVIRKVGSKHEKRAYQPGKSFDEAPSNVTSARNTEPKPI